MYRCTKCGEKIPPEERFIKGVRTIPSSCKKCREERFWTTMKELKDKYPDRRKR
jgi:predicted  nucleic acid-binding Zn-ribbon protein